LSNKLEYYRNLPVYALINQARMRDALLLALFFSGYVC